MVYGTARRNIPEGCHLHNRCRDNLESQVHNNRDHAKKGSTSMDYFPLSIRVNSVVIWSWPLTSTQWLGLDWMLLLHPPPPQWLYSPWRIDRLTHGTFLNLFIHLHLVGLPWTSCQPVAKASVYTAKYNKERWGQTFMLSGIRTKDLNVQAISAYASDRAATGTGTCSSTPVM
jgi:hypothetical protein